MTRERKGGATAPAPVPPPEDTTTEIAGAAPPAAAEASESPAPADSLESEIARLRAREDELLRALAELTNASRRRKADMEATVLYAEESIVRGLLPVLDDFDRALAAMRPDAADPVRAGVALVQDRLWRTLERHGLDAIRPQGGPFDPNLHDAVIHRPTHEAPPDHVLEVLQPGYRFRGRVLRHAQVVVSGPAEPVVERP